MPQEVKKLASIRVPAILRICSQLMQTKWAGLRGRVLKESTLIVI